MTKEYLIVGPNSVHSVRSGTDYDERGVPVLSFHPNGVSIHGERERLDIPDKKKPAPVVQPFTPGTVFPPSDFNYSATVQAAMRGNGKAGGNIEY